MKNLSLHPSSSPMLSEMLFAFLPRASTHKNSLDAQYLILPYCKCLLPMATMLACFTKG